MYNIEEKKRTMIDSIIAGYGSLEKTFENYT